MVLKMLAQYWIPTSLKGDASLEILFQLISLKLADLSSSKNKIINFDSGTVVLASALYFIGIRNMEILYDDTLKLIEKLKKQCNELS